MCVHVCSGPTRTTGQYAGLPSQSCHVVVSRLTEVVNRVDAHQSWYIYIYYVFIIMHLLFMILYVLYIF